MERAKPGIAVAATAGNRNQTRGMGAAATHAASAQAAGTAQKRNTSSENKRAWLRPPPTACACDKGTPAAPGQEVTLTPPRPSRRHARNGRDPSLAAAGVTIRDGEGLREGGEGKEEPLGVASIIERGRARAAVQPTRLQGWWG